MNWGENEHRIFFSYDKGISQTKSPLNTIQNSSKSDQDEMEEFQRRLDALQDTNIPPGGKYRFRQMIKPFGRMFTRTPMCAKGYVHSLQVIDDTEIKGIRYPVPYSKLPAFDAAFKSMLKNGVIEPSISRHRNTLMTIVKKDGTVRLCLDGRTLNRRMTSDQERTEPTEELLARF